MYHRIVDDFVRIDVEPDFSIIYVSLQLFTTPTIAAYLVTDHNLLATVLGTLSDYFARAIIPTDKVHATAGGPDTVAPRSRASSLSVGEERRRPGCVPQRDTRARLNVGHALVQTKSERYNNLFHDLRYILTKRGVQNFLVQHPDDFKKYTPARSHTCDDANHG